MIKTNIQFSPVNVKDRQKLDLRPGDTVRVWQKIQEKGKTRLQVFEGLLISRRHGREMGGTFTVRKIASGVGVEKIFPLYSPLIDKIEVVRRAKVRRAKLYYIREKTAKQIRRKMRGLADFVGVAYKEEDPEPEEEASEEESTNEVVKEKEETPQEEVVKEAKVEK